MPHILAERSNRSSIHIARTGTVTAGICRIPCTAIDYLDIAIRNHNGGGWWNPLHQQDYRAAERYFHRYGIAGPPRTPAPP